MNRGRTQGRLWAAVCVLLLAVAAVLLWRGLRHAKLGDIDPLGGGVGLVALVLAIGAWRQSSRAQRLADTDVGRWALELARAVATTESAQRRQLLSGQADPIDVEFVFTPKPPHDARGAGPRGSLRAVVDYFRELHPQRLVITGPPGAGKTVLAIELILSLLERRAPDEPVPVRVPASGWDPAVPVERWLAHRLTQAFGLPEATATALVEAHLILPVIDGLDEMDTEPHPGYGSRAGRALEALNSHQRFQARARMVLTCRTEQYEALTARNRRARDAARVTLTPVAPDKAWAFIESVIDTDPLPRWQPVLEALTQDDHPLAAALGTPWRLTLAVTVYEQRHPVTGDYLRDPGDLVHTNADLVDRHLLDSFIPAATAAATAANRNPRGYPPEQVRAWLTVLARYLDLNTDRPPFAGRSLSTTDLVLHELWPLAGNRSRVVATVVTAAPAAILPIVVALSSVPVWFTALCSVPVVALTAASWTRWPEPGRIDLSRAQLSVDRTHFLMLGLGIVSGLALGPTVGYPLGIACGLVFVFMGGFLGEVETRASAVGKSARGPIRDDLKAVLTRGLAAGLTAGLMSGLAFGLTTGLVLGAISGLTFGFTFGPNSGCGLAAVRYLAFLVCVRRRLPWRLGRFLDWCYADAGLIRTAGIAYQFRHLDLQEHLARPPARSSR